MASGSIKQGEKQGVSKTGGCRQKTDSLLKDPQITRHYEQKDGKTLPKRWPITGLKATYKKGKGAL